MQLISFLIMITLCRLLCWY